jgi:basic membrane lipoprotein Med (substrate-binding protein (PBP1-ABC) superfamily)
MTSVRPILPAEVHPMRPTAVVPALLIGALLVCTAALPVVGQDEEIDRPPPRVFKSADIAVITNVMDDPVVNDIVSAATVSAAEGIQTRRPPWEGTLPERNVLQAARDWGTEEYDIVVLSGVPAPDTIDIAREFLGTVYVGVDQGIPCVSADGIPDPSGTCEGDAATLVRNYESSEFAIDQAGYLAGIVAASASRNGRIGAIGGWPTCVDCNRYIQGFERGVRSVSPSASVEVAYLTDDHPEIANLDTETGRAFAEAFIDLHQLDVVLAASGGSSQGIIQAACDAPGGVLAIGTDVDRARAHPRLARCLLTSALRDYEDAIAESIFEVSRAFNEEDLFVGGGTTWDVSNGGVRLAPFGDLGSTLPVELPTRLQEATDGILAGTVETCADPCGVLDAPDDGSDATDPEASPAPDDGSV